jgi:hypothetical protein
MSDVIPREFRPATPDDEAFIFSAWLRSHHENGDWPHRLAIHRCILGEGKRCACCKYSSRRYFDDHKHVVLKLLRSAQTIVACNPARTSQVLGFVTFEPGLLHWVGVKKLYRRNGIANDLLEQAGMNSGNHRCSHWSVHAAHLSFAGRRLIYDPFAFGEPKQ